MAYTNVSWLKVLLTVSAIATLLVGCAATSTQEIAQSASSGKLGCAPAEIEIVQHDPISIAASRNWVAKCNGATYRCSGVSTGYFAYSNVSCIAIHPTASRTAGVVNSKPTSSIKEDDSNSARAGHAASPTGAPSQSSEVEVRRKSMTNVEVQKRLLALGYKAGVADGVIGKKTVEALKKFQSDNQLTVTGVADDETVEKLAQKAPGTPARSASSSPAVKGAAPITAGKSPAADL